VNYKVVQIFLGHFKVCPLIYISTPLVQLVRTLFALGAPKMNKDPPLMAW